ncbi:MAG: HAD-IC family P-type ATPase, partial [Stomatobaculum sp.]|nr:HAD-IC family P-type ATPase [Stomatobaculum sp.]
FVFEDEKTKCSEKDKEKLAALPPQYSHLYLAIGGRLAAVICIEDSLRPEAPEVLKELRKLGISRVVMMTGDNERTAEAVASMVGVDEFRAGVLPEDKADFVRREREAGHQVIMVGDGVNDSPALSESDAGIAISEGAAIAREIADITISENDLHQLVVLRKISAGLMRRIDSNYRSIISFNLLLILLGVGGFIDPSLSALLHNMSTLAIGVHSMTDLI